jgi:hypothetical protein
MSQEIDLCDDSGDNGEWPNTASVPSLSLSRKRHRDNEESSNDDHPHNEKFPGLKTTTGSAEFVVDLELADEVEVVSPHKKRGAIMTTENDAGSNDSEQTSRDDGSANMHSQKLSTSKPLTYPSGRQCWEFRLSELADYCKEHGHCNVPSSYSENVSLGHWVTTQRREYRRLRREGKTSPTTTIRIQELESLGFEWGLCNTAWEDRLSELADYRKIHGHCNVPRTYNKNTKLGKWVADQRARYNLYVKGKRSPMTLSRIRELEGIGFEWDRSIVIPWEDRLSELAVYRKIHGHCNVPQSYSENTKLAKWVTNQRTYYRLHVEGKTSAMTTIRIQELENLGFEWGLCNTAWEDRLSELADYRKIHGHCNVPKRCNTAWEDRLSELADYRKIHGHCNVPKRCNENTKLGKWVATQRYQYRLQVEGKSSAMTTFRIQELESLGFEWDGSSPTWEDRLSELADYRKIHGHCNVPTSNIESTKLARWVANQRTQYRFHRIGKRSQMTLPRIQELESLGFDWQPSVFQGKVILLKKPSLEDYARRDRERAVEAAEYVQTTAQT